MSCAAAAVVDVAANEGSGAAASTRAAATPLSLKKVRAGDSADRRADYRAFKNAEARDDRTSGRAEGSTAESAGGDTAKSRVIALRRALVILPVLDVAVDIAVVVAIGPNRVADTADRGANRGALDHADARNNRAKDGAAGGAVSRAFSGVTGHPVVGGACAERDRTRQSNGQN